MLQIVFGIFFCAFPVRLLILNYRWVLKGFKTTGTITKITTVGDSENSKSYGPTDTPEIQFYDRLNNKHIVQSPLGMGKANFSLGDEITIYYNPENPSQISVDKGWFKLSMVLLFLVGIGQIVLGILGWLNLL